MKKTGSFFLIKCQLSLNSDSRLHMAFSTNEQKSKKDKQERKKKQTNNKYNKNKKEYNI